MKRIKYDLIGAYEYGIYNHPELQVSGLGMDILKYEGHPVGDCVIMEVDKLVENLPDYIEELK